MAGNGSNPYWQESGIVTQEAPELQSSFNFLKEIKPESTTLMDRFIVPPFSVLDTRQGYWQNRKRAWGCHWEYKVS